ncbi:hypothetical protein JGE88_24165, partial [Salmonella enterica subsp. enterica serovar Indiana]|nr:hypothetical protein [Salmonella enterica subsp. enterica serovar Indiana]
GDDDLPGEIEDHVRPLVGHLPATFNLFNRIRVEQKCDYVCSRLKEFCLFEWPVKSRLPNELSPFFQLKEDISYCDRYLLYGARLIIPPALQLEILTKLHDCHLGISKCRDRAKQSVWWLGLSSQLRNLVETCPKCVEERKNIVTIIQFSPHK